MTTKIENCWGEFLHFRAQCIDAFKAEGRPWAEIVHTLSLDPVQAQLIAARDPSICHTPRVVTDARRYRLLISLIKYAASDTPHEELPEVERAVVDICGEHVQDIGALVAAIDDVLARFPNAGQA